MQFSDRYSTYAPIVLRLAMAAVFAWFGASQLFNSRMWTGVVPPWASALSGMDALTIIHVNGAFEVVAALLLAAGIAVRTVAGLLFLHLLIIVSDFGFTPVGVRDFGLSFATLSIMLFGNDALCYSRRRTQPPAEETNN